MGFFCGDDLDLCQINERELGKEFSLIIRTLEIDEVCGLGRTLIYQLGRALL